MNVDNKKAGCCPSMAPLLKPSKMAPKTINYNRSIMRRIGHKRLLLFAMLLVVLSIMTLSYFCPENICQLNKSSSSQSTDSSLLWISSSRSFSSSSALTSTQYLPQRQNKHFVNNILVKKYAYDFDDYLRMQSVKVHQIAFDTIIDVNHSVRFNMSSNDVMVFLHMQKTGGSAFDRHLVRDLILKQPCKCDAKHKKKCRCFRPGSSNKYWLFSRYSIGWKCGLHADYTELFNCVERVLNQVEQRSTKVPIFYTSNPSLPDSNEFSVKPFLPTRRYFYVTLLRDPIARFLSEFKHVQRGATWKTSRHWCSGRLPTRAELPLCYRGSNWRNVTLDEFISCPHNLAFNRQTRMLADLSLVNCYNKSTMTSAERDAVLLYSAKQNLRRMAYFGLCEEQLASQYLFERTFQLQFQRAFVQFNQTRSHQVYATLSYDTVQQIRELNHLDMALYSFAKQLFRERFALAKSLDANFESRYQYLAHKSQSQLLLKNKPKAKVNISASQNRHIETVQAAPLIDDNEDDDEDNSPNSGYNNVDDSVEDYYSNHLDGNQDDDED